MSWLRFFGNNHLKLDPFIIQIDTFLEVYGEPRVDRRTTFWNEFSQLHADINQA